MAELAQAAPPSLSGRTLITGIFGDPVEHSLSPAMHNAAYAALGIDRVYVPFHVRPEQLASAVRAIPALGILGVNVTVPHKEHVARLMLHLSAEAKLLGAVNCIVNRASSLYGDNTDARGLELALRELKVALRAGGKRNVIVIGAGGGAAAAILASRRLGARRIVVANRTRIRAVGLARRFAKFKIDVRGLDALTDRELLGSCALIINATSAGLGSERFPALDYQSTPADSMFYDLLYSRTPGGFLKPALALGRPAADGALMLLNQGVLAFRLFNRIAPPAEVMRRALLEKLGRPTT
jgi:shikimate dehydrogenase